MKKDLSFLKGLTITHRGLHDAAGGTPEDSLLAFKTAIKHHQAIEFDLQILKDGQIIVFHDYNLKRLTGLDKAVKDCTYDEIKNLKLLNTNEKIPLLKEVLKLVNGRVVLDVEFKIGRRAGVLEQAACQLLDNYQGKFLVTSFSPLSVKWFKDHRPEFLRGQLIPNLDKSNRSVVDMVAKFLPKATFFSFLTQPDFVVTGVRSTSKKQIRSWQKKHLPIIFWTIRNNRELKFARKHGDALIYEDISV